MKITLLALLASAFAIASPLSTERIVLHTIAGDIVLSLFPDKAPKHVEQVLRLVRMGAYDSTHFYRVEPGFVLQTSLIEDRLVPVHPEVTAQAKPLPLEISDLKHHTWTLSMARQDGDRNSATSSFSILLGDAPHLDGEYTVFGQVVDGFDVINELLKVPLNPDKKPGIRLTIKRAEVLTARQVASLQLAPATALYKATPIPTPFLVGICVILLISLITFLAREHLAPQQILSFHLLNVLVVVFMLFVALTPRFNTHTWLGGAMSLLLLGTFWLMGRFEGARK